MPGGTTSAAVGVGYGGVPSPPPNDNLGDFDFGGVGASTGRVSTGGGGGGGRAAMFTAGIRESLAGGVSWDLRGTKFDAGDRSDAYGSYRGEAVGGEVPSRAVEGTPDHASGGNDYGMGRGVRSRVVTPESGGASDPAQASSRFLSSDGKRGEYEGDDREDEQEARLAGGGAIRGIRAF